MKTARHVPPRVVHVGLMLSLAGLHAAEPARELADLSLEELMNEPVTSVSKREQRKGDVAAAIFVLNNDELRRSGATTIAEALRLVPGLQVAAISASDWAISARGFNSRFANKLLALTDGRALYLPQFSGIYWDAQQAMLEDIDRIEVIRGPGATVWGANAVNGVINIVSKPARETQGTLLYGAGGNVARVLGGVRHGGTLGPGAHYRVYGLYHATDDYRLANGRPANDGWEIVQAGFRTDRERNDRTLTAQGDVYSGDLLNGASATRGFNVLGRWTHRRSDRSSLEIQAYFDHVHRDEAALALVKTSTADVSLQQTFGVGARHDFIWGAGYRFSRTRLERSNTVAITILDHEVPLDLFSAFVQDEIKLVPDSLTLTLGAKLEHNDLTGFEVQPSIRLVAKPAKNQTVWAAVSRATRTPSMAEGTDLIRVILGPPAPGPDGRLYLPTFVGNPGAESEVLWAYELGYRTQPDPRLSVDLAVFYHRYPNLANLEPIAFLPGTPVGAMLQQPRNRARGESYGAEVAAILTPTPSWRLSASYSLLLLRLRDPIATDDVSDERNAPTHQAVLRSSHDFSRRITADVQVRYVDNVDRVPAYATADLRLAWRPTERLELALVGQNLLDDRQLEQQPVFGPPGSEVPRAFHGKITCRF